MDPELQSLLTALGATMGGTAVTIWVATRPHVIEAFKHALDWWEKRRVTEDELIARKQKRLDEQEAELALMNKAALTELGRQIATLRNEVNYVRLMHQQCQTEVGELRGQVRTLTNQNLRISAQYGAAARSNGQALAILRALENKYPTDFARFKMPDEAPTP